MKLISCKIEGFGALCNKEIVFEEGINSFCENNGSGKSTLSAFIKAMFFSMKSSRTKALSDRKHYMPLSGKKYGGNLTLEKDGKIYRIERFFDKSSDTKDSYKLYIDGIDATGEHPFIGEEIFGVDIEGFERLFFITSDDVETKQNSSIKEKLTEAIGFEGGDVSCEAALKILEESAKYYKPLRGSNGEIARLKDDKMRYEAVYRDNLKVASELERLRSEEADAKKSLEETRRKRRSAEGREQYLKCEKLLGDMLSSLEGLKEKKKALEEKYGGVLPGEDEIIAADTAYSESVKAGEALRSNSFGSDKEAEYKELCKTFESGIPSDSEIENHKDKYKKYTFAKSESESIKRSLEAPLGDNEAKFVKNAPSDEKMREMSEKAESIRRIKADIQRFTEQNLKPSEKKKSSALFTAMLIAGIILLIAGIVLIFITLPAGISLTVSGAALCIVSLLVRALSGRKDSGIGLDGKISTLTVERRRLEDEVHSFTVPYGYFSESGAEYAFDSLRGDYENYLLLEKTKSENEKHLIELDGEIASLDKEIRTFLSRFSLDISDGENAFLTLRLNVGRFVSLENDRASAQSRTKEAKKKYEESEKVLAAFFSKYGKDDSTLARDFINGVTFDKKNYESIEKAIKSDFEKCEQFAEENGITPEKSKEYSESGDCMSSSELEEIEKALTGKIMTFSSEIDNAERASELAEKYSESILVVQEEIDKAFERHKLLTAAKDYLKESAEYLRKKYSEPVEQAFGRYSDLLMKTNKMKVSFGNDLEVFVEKSGENVSEDYLSSGERCILLFCLRLALTDVICREEKPIVILDDPFTSLDAEHLENVSQTVKELSKDRQIISFCCHSSRDIR